MIVIQKAVTTAGVPSGRSLRSWAHAALGGVSGELTLRIVGSAESRRLNKRYRGKDQPTNVLSFFYPPLASRLSPAVLGDIVVCAPMVAREAREQHKPVRAHWAHMVVHGVLHLLGHDHLEHKDAERMEARERAILKSSGFADPYLLS